MKIAANILMLCFLSAIKYYLKIVYSAEIYAFFAILSRKTSARNSHGFHFWFPDDIIFYDTLVKLILKLARSADAWLMLPPIVKYRIQEAKICSEMKAND